MYHYLFTNDLRISHLEDSLIEAGKCFSTGSVPSASVDKNANNNMNTLGFYFNLTLDSLCAKECASKNVRRVVLNFIKKFQFPNPRTKESYLQTTSDGIVLAPMRVILQLLYVMNMQSGNNAYLSKKEIADFIFFNSAVAKSDKIDLMGLIKQIEDYREYGNYPTTVETDSDNRIWKQEERQVREMVKVLTWSGCVTEDSKGNISLCSNNLTVDNKADLFDILSYGGFWKPKGDGFNDIKSSYQEYMDLDETASESITLIPEWFEKKAVKFPTLDTDAEEFLKKFREKFSVKKLTELEGKDILDTIFLNPNNKSNLCYTIEFDKVCRDIFGSIRSGTAYKYGLHYSQKNSTWATGTGKKPQFISEEEAVELGGQIRDYLVAGAEVIANAADIVTLTDYVNLYKELNDVTDGYVNKMWFVKYYALLYPEVFPPIYSSNAQHKVLKKLGIEPQINTIARIGQIRGFVDKCNISNVMFNQIFWTYCNDDEENEEVEVKEQLKSCLEVVREPRTNNIYPLNFIVYGVPGTGKTYSMVEYALAIINNQPIDEFRKTNTDRKVNVSKYKEYVKNGQIVFTTFHQNYGYEEFIQGLRLDTESETLSFKTIDGVFKRIADKALNDDQNKNYIIIVDEINRANISKVFGELITLIEGDKRWGELNEMSATLQSGDQFAVPNNLYIVGTMNSADKSISLIDAALRRRFSFIEQRPDSSVVTDATLKAILEKLNEILVKELDSTDLLIGHSYFINKTINDLANIMNNNIIPLLYEYFYDNRKKVATVLKDVLDIISADVEIVDDKVGRLRVQKKV